MTSQTTVAGIDGCRSGWVVVITRGGRFVSCEVTADLRTVADQVADGAIAVAGVDMPIGLPPARRESDRAARRYIGPRRSSVFPTPTRATLAHLADYPRALEASRNAMGIGLSKQAFNLLPKIAHLDGELRRTDTDDRIVEVHPECSFVALHDGAFLESKKTPRGAAQRRALLTTHFGAAVSTYTDTPPLGAVADDVLDALAVAWTAARIAAGTAITLGDPSQHDDLGRPCLIWI